MWKPRFIAPAGTPVKISELAGWIYDSLTGKDRRQDLCNAIKSRYHLKHCFLMSSGRAAMAMLFSMLKKHDQQERTEIVLPSYTCYSVPAAAEIAGLQVRICDIDPHTLSYDMEQFKSIDLGRVLCVVSANLYGYPDDLEKLEELTRQAGCYLIDDAAQSMNARINQRYAGTFGDIGLYSLDKGKNITSIQGGIIVTNDDLLATLIKEEIEILPDPSLQNQILDSIKLVLYAALLHPVIYWIPANIPAFGLGKTIYTTQYLFCKYSRPMSALAWRLFKRIEEISSMRSSRAMKLIDKLKDNENIEIIQTVNDSAKPVYLRVPFLLKDARVRQQIIKSLQNAGIGATCSYPASIADLNELEDFSVIHNNIASNGRMVAESIITLPSLKYLNDNDIDKIARIISSHQQ